MTRQPGPLNLRDFKGKPTFVAVQKKDWNDADMAATRSLIETYTDKDGFHCPRCGATITNPEEAIDHLATEINKAMQELGDRKLFEKAGKK